MIHINVAQEIKVKNTENKKLYSFLLLIFVFCIFGYGSVYYFAYALESETSVLQAQNNEKTNELDKIKDKKNKIQKLKSNLEEIQNRSREIENLDKKRKKMVFILDKIQQFHIEKLWLDSFSIEEDKVIIKGYAVDNFVVAEYVAKLRTQTKDYENIVIDHKKFDPPIDIEIEDENEVEEVDLSKKVEDDSDEDEESSGSDSLSDELYTASNLNFRNVNLVRTAAKEIGGYPYQSFEINFDIDTK